MKTLEEIFESVIVEKAVDVSESDWLDFEDDYNVHLAKKLYGRALGAGMQDKAIAAAVKNKTIEKVVQGREDLNKKEKADKASERRSEREEKAEAKRNKPKMSEKQFDAMIKGAADDFKADNPEEDFEGIAPDLADSLLNDPDMREYISKVFGVTKRETQREIIADRL